MRGYTDGMIVCQEKVRPLAPLEVTKLILLGGRGCASLIRGCNVYLNGNFFDEDVGLKGKVCMLRVLAISAMDEEMLVDELEGYDFGCFPLKPH